MFRVPKQRHFVSDNRSGMCPEAGEALRRANSDHTPSYGEDPWTQRAADLIREMFETDCDVYFVLTGTAANALALASMGRSYSAFICHQDAHVVTSECGAPVFFSGGMTVLPCTGEMGKIDVVAMERLATGEVDVHSAPPRVLTFAQATEVGTVYQLAELAELCGRAKSLGLRVHMDGARFANAVMSLGCTPAEASWKAGIDVLCFGGTKNGMAMGEAVVFFDRSLSADFGYRCMQGGQLASKMRFVCAQWVGMLETGAWRRHACHANAMARRLETGLRETVPHVRVMYPVQANAVFAEMPVHLQSAVRNRGWEFFTFIGETGVRLMCGWDTTTDDVDRFIQDVRGEIANSKPEL
jgi:threonine aldolase